MMCKKIQCTKISSSDKVYLVETLKSFGYMYSEEPLEAAIRNDFQISFILGILYVYSEKMLQDERVQELLLEYLI